MIADFIFVFNTKYGGANELIENDYSQEEAILLKTKKILLPLGFRHI